jgi:hypothetical protein
MVSCFDAIRITHFFAFIQQKVQLTTHLLLMNMVSGTVR